RGNFGSDMETKLQRDGAQVVPYKMYHLIGREEGSVVFFSSSTAAVGNVESLKAFLDARGKSNGMPASMAAKMKEIPAASQIWAVYTGGGVRLPFDLQGNFANADRVIQSVQTAAFNLDLRDGAKGLLRMSTAGDEPGKKLNEMIRGLVGF